MTSRDAASDNTGACSRGPGLLTVDDALTRPSPLTPACGGCGRPASPAALEEALRGAWRDGWELTCETCGWHGRLTARNMGELLTLFKCKTVSEMAGGFADRVDGPEESWIDFYEPAQVYVVGYSGYIAGLRFPIDPLVLMDTIEEFDDLFIEAAEAFDEDAEYTCD